MPNQPMPSRACHYCRFGGRHCRGRNLTVRVLPGGVWLDGCICDCRDPQRYAERLLYRIEAEHGAEIARVAERSWAGV